MADALMTPAQEALARSNLYGMLARCFRAEVDAALLAELRCPETAAALAAAGVDVQAALPQGDDRRLLEDLAREYCRLFLLTFSPHESVQRGEGQLWGGYTVQVRDELDDLGLAAAGSRSLLPDHLAIELEIMQHLAEVESGLLEAGGEEAAARVRARQRSFLDQHLLRWAPRYLDTVAQAAAQPLYAMVAGLGAAFLRSERT